MPELAAWRNAYLEWVPVKNLTFKTSIGVDYLYIKDQAFAPGEIKRAESNGGYASVGNRDGYNWVWENTVNYTNTFEMPELAAWRNAPDCIELNPKNPSVKSAVASHFKYEVESKLWYCGQWRNSSL